LRINFDTTSSFTCFELSSPQASNILVTIALQNSGHSPFVLKYGVAGKTGDVTYDDGPHDTPNVVGVEKGITFSYMADKWPILSIWPGKDAKSPNDLHIKGSFEVVLTYVR